MVIWTIRESYSVLRKLEGSPEIAAYLCTKAENGNGGRYLVLKPMSQAISKKMLVCFMEYTKCRQMSDFEETFIKDGAVWVVFRWHEGEPLEEVLARETSIQARLQIGKGLVKSLLAEDLPPYLQFEAADLRNIAVDESLSVHVNYLLYEPEAIEDTGFDRVQMRLSAVLGKIFEMERGQEVPEEVQTFLETLANAGFSDETAVYRAFFLAGGALSVTEKDEEASGTGILIRGWKKLTAFLGKCIPVLYGVLVSGLLFLLIYVCIMSVSVPEDRNIITNIGKLSLETEEERTGGGDQAYGMEK